MSKTITLVVLALLFIANPVFAVNAGSCEAQAARIKDTERNKFMVSCLAKLSSSANVKQAAQQKKRGACEQNARNHSLQGVKKDDYLRICMQKNEAVAAIADVKGTNAIGVEKPAETLSTKPAAKPRGASCEERAGKDGLKGAARKSYIKKCKGQK